jgi:hypothetical protein
MSAVVVMVVVVVGVGVFTPASSDALKCDARKMKREKKKKKKRMVFSLLLFLGLVVAQQANVSVSSVNDLPANLASNTAYRFLQTVALTAPATSVVGHRDGSSVLDCSAVGFCFSFAGAGAGMQNFSLDNVAVLATPFAGQRTFVVGVSVASSATATNLSNIRYEKAAALQFPTLSLVQLATNATSAFVDISNVQALSVVSLVEPAPRLYENLYENFEAAGQNRKRILEIEATWDFNCGSKSLDRRRRARGRRRAAASPFRARAVSVSGSRRSAG